MSEQTPEERWAVMMVQARRFADKESFVDAVARARLVRDQMREARRQAGSAEEVARLDRLLARAERDLARYDKAHAAWLERIADLARARREGADAEMKRPLPLPPR